MTTANPSLPALSHSPSASSSSLSSTLLDEHDEDVQMAVRALGAMRNGSSKDASTSQTTLASEEDAAASQPPGFVGRMSHFPIVNSALRVYEQGKASSRVVKYGAKIMENSVRTISRPVIQRLPVNVEQLDDFACRQLDRIDAYRRPAQSQEPEGTQDPDDDQHDDGPTRDIEGWIDDSATYDGLYMGSKPSKLNLSTSSSVTSSASTSAATSPIATEPPSHSNVRSRSTTPVPLDHPSLPSPKRRRIEHHPYTASKSHQRQRSHGSATGTRHHSRNSSFDRIPPMPSLASFPEPSLTTTTPTSATHPAPSTSTAVTPRSRWHTVLTEAGGISAAISEESMRRLKFCLSWLLYATDHIDKQILRLKDFTESMAEAVERKRQSRLSPLSSPTTPTQDTAQSTPHSAVLDTEDQQITPAQAATLNALRADIVNTVRQVIDIVGKYAGGAGPGGLGGEERQRVKGFILGLPGRWKEAMAGAPPAASSATSASPNAPPSATSAIGAAQRVLTLATESLDMMRGVTGVVKDSLDRADTWVGRLGSVGVTRRNSSQLDVMAVEGGASPPPASSERTEAESRLPIDAPSPGVGGILGRMTLEEEETSEDVVKVKAEEMEVDP